jgi:hypothetical protein
MATPCCTNPFSCLTFEGSSFAGLPVVACAASLVTQTVTASAAPASTREH